MEETFESNWNRLRTILKEQYGEELDVQSIVFLIGIQELGHGYKKYNKNQKLDVMHVGVCTLLEPFGFYEYEGKDEEGWPHWKTTEKLPHLKPAQQSAFIKEAIVEYFKKGELI